MPRRFFLFCHRVPPDGTFSLNDLAGSGGRLDEIARVVNSTFIVSNGIRRDCFLDLWLVRDLPRARRIQLSGARLKYLNPDERSTSALLRNALIRSWDRPGETLEITPGIWAGPLDLDGALETWGRGPNPIWLQERGTLLRRSDLPDDLGVLLSDPYDLTTEEVRRVEGFPHQKISLGPVSLPSSHCIVLLHNELDLRTPEGRPSEAPPG